MITIRRILVAMDGSNRDIAALGAALTVAVGFDAHVDALHARLQPAETLPFVGEGMSAALVQEMVDLTERESASHAAAARATFETLTREAGVPLRSAPGEVGASAQFVVEDLPAEQAIVAAGRLADLIVVPRPVPTGPGSTGAAFTLALFETGRPVLVAGQGVGRSGGQGSLPGGDAGPGPSVCGRVAIAWDGGAQAARALAASLPFLVRAEAVTVLVAGGNGGEAADAGAVARYLAWHGVDAECRTVSPRPSVAEAIVAGMAGADLLVMGGYSHSRLLELILGGVTRHMIEKAAVPLLLAH